MTDDPVAIIENALHAAGRNVKRRGDNLHAQCPAHDDGNPSLSVAPGTVRDVLLHCHAGCKPDDILAALNLQWTDFGEQRQEIEHAWQYHDEHGTLAYEVVRKPGKKYLQRRPVGNDWEWNLKGVERLLYRLPAVIKAVKAGQAIWVAEGEKDVDRLVAAGVCATCNSGGAGKFTASMADWLQGATNVIIVADLDVPGADHAAEIAKLLDDRDVPNRTVQAAEGKDASHHFMFGHGIDDFVASGERNTDNLPTPFAIFPEPPEFPVDIFPDWIADQINAVAADMQCPTDLPAQLAITALSIGCAKRIKVHVKSTWYEPTNTYLATALDPGENKSPAVKQIIGPVWDHERHLRDSTATERELAADRLEYLVGERTKKIRAGEMAAAAALSDEIKGLPDINPPRLIIDDATPGALVQLMAANGERMAIVSTEGGVFSMMRGKYSQDRSSELEVYLKSYSGDGHSEARVSRQATPDLVEPALTIGVTVQPSVLADLAGVPELTDRGLLPRFMLSIPASLVGTRIISEAVEMNPAISQRYKSKLCDMLDTLHDAPEQVVPMSREALAIFGKARQQLENARGPGRELSAVTAWTIKLESTIARVAGLLATAWHPRHQPTEIDVATLRSVLRLADYWIAHAVAAFGSAGVGIGPSARVAERLVTWLHDDQIESFTMRQAYSVDRRSTPGPADVVDALQLLVDHKWIAPVDNSTDVEVGRRGSPSPEFTVSADIATPGGELRAMRAMRGVFGVNLVESCAPCAVRLDVGNKTTPFITPFTDTPPAHGAHGAQLYPQAIPDPDDLNQF